MAVNEKVLVWLGGEGTAPACIRFNTVTMVLTGWMSDGVDETTREVIIAYFGCGRLKEERTKRLYKVEAKLKRLADWSKGLAELEKHGAAVRRVTGFERMVR